MEILSRKDLASQLQRIQPKNEGQLHFVDERKLAESLSQLANLSEIISSDCLKESKNTTLLRLFFASLYLLMTQLKRLFDQPELGFILDSFRLDIRRQTFASSAHLFR